MDTTQRKKISVITRYAVENFSQGDWLSLGQLTGYLSTIQDHPRLLRAISFGDDDYESCAAEVLGSIFEKSETAIEEVIDDFDIDLWYEQKYPDKYQRVFVLGRDHSPTFWKPDTLKLFVSHLAKNRKKIARLKAALDTWGVSAFIAHQDIEPSREWQAEIESGLATMDAMVAVVEPGFRDSAWTDQEVGYALGRGVDVIPLLIGVEPHGFVAKIQGIQVKNRLPTDVAEELALLLLKKPRYRSAMLLGMARALTNVLSDERRARIRRVDSLITDEQMRHLLETSGLSADDKGDLTVISARVGAFTQPEIAVAESEDIPF
jgi:AbiJ N-terminal domain 5/TIR domain